MQGACDGPVPAALQALVTGAPLQPLAPGQCLLVTDLGGIQLLGSGNIWLDNLYLRARYTGRTPAFSQSLLTIGDLDAAGGTVEEQPLGAYITGVQIQGDNVFERAGEVQSVLGVGVAAPTFMSGVLPLCMPMCAEYHALVAGCLVMCQLQLAVLLIIHTHGHRD